MFIPSYNNSSIKLVSILSAAYERIVSLSLLILFFISLTFPIQLSKLQAQVNTNNFITRPWSLFFLNEKTGFVAGWNFTSGGEIWKTVNSGDSWYKLLSGDPDYFYRVFAFNERDILVTGSRGKILKTTDGGLTWNNYSYPTYSGLADICFPNASTGYIAGGDFFPNPVFIKTTNSGVTWISMPHDTLHDLGAVNFLDGNYGYAGGNRIIMKTTDGGKTYNEYFNDDFFNISSIAILDTSTAYLSSGGLIAKTENAGKDWSTIFMYSTVKKIKLLDKLTIVGINSSSDGVFIKTTNGGTKWEIQKIDIVESFTDMFFVNDTTGWITARKDWQGSLYKTSDKGDHWALQIATISKPVNFSLSQNYPNPFNPQTKIEYELPQDGFVQIKIYDVLGRLITTLVGMKQSIGKYETEFDGSKYSSGVYFCILEFDNQIIETKKMILIK